MKEALWRIYLDSKFKTSQSSGDRKENICLEMSFGFIFYFQQMISCHLNWGVLLFFKFFLLQTVQ